MKAKTLNMCEGSFLKKIIVYTIPIMLTALHFLYKKELKKHQQSPINV